MSSFLDRLDIQLMRKLKGWKPWRDSNFFKAYAGYYITKPEWGESYWIGFECYPDGSRVDIGITWETDNTRKQALAELLTAAADIPLSRDLVRPTLELGLCDMRSPSPTGASRMCCGECIRPKFVTDLANQLLKIVEVSEHIIDRLVRKK
jgi:hypothetical protein